MTTADGTASPVPGDYDEIRERYRIAHEALSLARPARPPELVAELAVAYRNFRAALRVRDMAWQREFSGLVKASAKRYVAAGWRVTGTGLIFHGTAGHWGHVVFRSPDMFDATMLVQPMLGALSPYLMRVVNKLDPNRTPPTQFLQAQAWLELVPELCYTRDPRPMPTLPSFNVAFNRHDPPELCPGTAPEWLDRFFHMAVPPVESLCSDLAIRDWFLDRYRARRAGSFELRYAVLLTRRLGLDNELPALLDLAERASVDEGFGRTGRVQAGRDRSTNYPQEWSHRRFLRFLEQTPP